MKTLSDLLHGLAESIAEIEQRCRDIHENKNLADIVGMARAKIAQAAQHPDALGTTAAAFVGEEPAPEGLQPVPPPLAPPPMPE